MADPHDAPGLVHAGLGVAVAATFLAVGSLDDTTGLLGGGVLVAVGLAGAARDRLGVDPTAVGSRWRGAFWITAGIVVGVLALLGSATVGQVVNGLVLGTALVLYGLVLGR